MMFSIGNITGILQSNIFWNVVPICKLIFSLFINFILQYGTIACVIMLIRGNEISFGTIFKKIVENFGKILAILGRILLEVIAWIIIYINVIFKSTGKQKLM